MIVTLSFVCLVNYLSGVFNMTVSEFSEIIDN